MIYTEGMMSEAEYNRERFGEFCKRHQIVYGGDCPMCEGEFQDAHEAALAEGMQEAMESDDSDRMTPEELADRIDQSREEA